MWNQARRHLHPFPFPFLGLWGVGGAFGFELFFPAGEEPEDVGEAVEEAGDFGVGDGLFGAGEVEGDAVVSWIE